MSLNQYYYSSPLGTVHITLKNKSLIKLCFDENYKHNQNKDDIFNENAREVIKQLDEYFQGIRKYFDLNLSIEGTLFQKKVLGEVAKIPYGMTKSYTDIAHVVGNDKAVRAVGNANNCNKLPIIIPCHRVIGKGGGLTGYAGGLWRKQWLLNHEKKFC